MLPDEANPKVYVAHRMLPPGPHKYFYSLANKLTVAKDQNSQKNVPLINPTKDVKYTTVIPEKDKIDLKKKYFTNIVTRERLAPAVKSDKPKDNMKDILKKAF